MNCHICGGNMKHLLTDLPFKLDLHIIRIVKDLPVLECEQCGEFLIEDPVMVKIEPLLNINKYASELEVMRYAA